MNDVPWSYLQVFEAVVRTGSLSAAARELTLTQPTVRRQLDVLEATWGTVLFVRSTQGLVATPAAEAAAAVARSMAHHATALQRAVQGGMARRQVRLGASDIVGREFLVQWLSGWLDEFPGLRLEIVTSNRNAALADREVDIAMRMVEPNDAGLVRRRIGTTTLGLYAHPDYIARYGAPRDIVTLAEHRLIGPDRAVESLAALQAVGVDPDSLYIRSDDDSVQLQAVRNGVGIGICHEVLSLTPVPLVRVVPEISVQLPLWAVMHEDVQRQPAMRELFSAVVRDASAFLIEGCRV